MVEIDSFIKRKPVYHSSFIVHAYEIYLCSFCGMYHVFSRYFK